MCPCGLVLLPCERGGWSQRGNRMWEGQGGSSANSALGRTPAGMAAPGAPGSCPSAETPGERSRGLLACGVRAPPPQCALDPLAEPRARIPILSGGVGSIWFFALLVPVQLDTLPQIPPGPAASQPSF